MTAIGVTGYLLYLEEPILALISTVVFAKLIVFHFIMDYYDKSIKKKSQDLSLSLTAESRESTVQSSRCKGKKVQGAKGRRELQKRAKARTRE